MHICERSARKFYGTPPRCYCASSRFGALYSQVERYKISAREHFKPKMLFSILNRVGWICFFLPDAGYSRPVILHAFPDMPDNPAFSCRIPDIRPDDSAVSGPTLLLNRCFTYWPAYIKWEFYTDPNTWQLMNEGKSTSRTNIIILIKIFVTFIIYSILNKCSI